MIFVEDITTPKNTPKSAPLKTVLDLDDGLIYKIEVVFPPGSYGFLGLAIMDGGHQVWPTKHGTFFRGDNVTVSFDDLYFKNVAPFQFDVLTYNLDDTYSHEVLVRIGLVSLEVYIARFIPSVGYEDFVAKLKALSDQQQAQLNEENKAIIKQPLSWLARREKD